MLRWMCGVTLRDGMWTEELMDCLGVVSVDEVITKPWTTMMVRAC